MHRNRYLGLILLSVSLLAACTPSRLTIDDDFSVSGIPADSLVASLPDYSGDLLTAKGKGRAVVSEPGNSDRVTIEFETDTSLSLITIKNRIGIEGGKMLVDQDSILIYNKIDKYARKMSVTDGRMTSLNELASINLLDLLNFKVKETIGDRVFESETHFMLRIHENGTVLISRENGLIEEVNRPLSSGLPYSKIIYESYGNAGGYTLPRKITIFSADGNSKVLFQVRDLSVNPDNLNLSINIPGDIPIQRL